MFLEEIKKESELCSRTYVRRKMAVFRNDERTINLLAFSGQLWFLLYSFLFFFFFGCVVLKVRSLYAKNYGWVYAASVFQVTILIYCASNVLCMLVIYVATQVTVLKITYKPMDFIFNLFTSRLFHSQWYL